MPLGVKGKRYVRPQNLYDVLMVNSKKGTFLTFLLLILPIRGLDDPLWRNKLRVFKSLEVSSIWLLQGRGAGVWGSCGGGVGSGGGGGHRRDGGGGCRGIF